MQDQLVHGFIHKEVLQVAAEQSKEELKRMSTIYHLNFENKTPEVWTLCVYQEWPKSPGLKSVSWKQTSVPNGGQSGVEWEVVYSACLSGYKQSGGKGVYTASQTLPTQLGAAWDIRFESNVQQLFPGPSAQPGSLLIQNSSGLLANPAIGVDNDIAMVKADVYSGNSAQFVAEPKYYVSLFSDLERGEVISGNQIHGPLSVTFEGGKTELNYEALIEGSTFIFREIGGTQAATCSLEEMEERKKHVAQQRLIDPTEVTTPMEISAS